MLDELTRATAEDLLRRDVVSRIWARDARVWDPAGTAASPSVHHGIAHRLGWLDAPATMKAHIRRVSEAAHEIKNAGFTTAYLLGMGGSSLCAEVLRDVCGVRDGGLKVHVLDTTDEATLNAAAGRLDDGATLFLVASKSGSTVEVSAMERFFASEVRRRHSDHGRRFLAITDPGTVLEHHATREGYRAIFVNPPDIGGRFSALSLFGLVPAALLGLVLRDLLDAGVECAEGCRQTNLTNPGLVLGSFIGGWSRAGRDKLTLLLPPSMKSFGLWVEQLVAESTGKLGTGTLPVVDEPLGRPDEYGDDRAFVALATDDDAPDGAPLDALERAGHPVLRVNTRRAALGAEFFRWEFATAVAGAVLHVNPFDEPNVTESKDRTKALLERYAAEGRLPDAGSATVDDVHRLLASIRSGDYVAFLSYLSPDATVASTMEDIRLAIRRRNRVATTFGIGPRYLHSTGQYHKGGPDRGLFVLLTMDDATATPVPGMPYSFSVLKRAQALGDLQALEARSRRVIRLHIRRGDNPAQALADVFRRALE